MRRTSTILAIAVAVLAIVSWAGPSLYGRWMVSRALADYGQALASPGFEDDLTAPVWLSQAYESASVYAPALREETRYRLLPLLFNEDTARTMPLIDAVCFPNTQSFELVWLLKQAHTFVAAGREGQAEHIYRWLAASCPDTFEVYADWAVLEENRGDYKAGIALLERAVTTLPRMAPPDMLDKPDAFWQAIALAGAYGDMGDLLYKDHQLEAAIGALERSVALHPAGTVSPWLYNFMGIIYFEAGRIDQAEVAFEQALALKPDLPDAPGYLERIRARQ